MSKIAHLTSVHTRYDTRIFLKMARSLASAGYSISLVVADGRGDEHRDGIDILDAGKSRGRLDRMLGATRRVLKLALVLDADLYHIHDPELLLAGLALKRHGKRVIFDSHEDVPRQVLSKPYLPRLVRHPVSAMVGSFERLACRRLDHVIGATPVISGKFRAMGIPTTNVNNYPILDELEITASWNEKTRQVCYIGGIASTRGIFEIVRAAGLTASGARLVLAGAFTERVLKTTVEAMPGWANVEAVGFLSRKGVHDVLTRSLAGLVTLHPTPAYLESLPIKMFEYMSASLPVIASNFPLWREIIEGNECGICVDPLDPKAIAAAIDRLVENPDVARQMGKNGRKAVQERYNWNREEKKLLALYESLLRMP